MLTLEKNPRNIMHKGYRANTVQKVLNAVKQSGFTQAHNGSKKLNWFRLRVSWLKKQSSGNNKIKKRQSLKR